MKDKTIVQFIWKFAKKYKWAFLLSYVALLGELAFNQLLPIFLGKVVNSAVYDANKRAFLFSTLLYALVFIGYKASGFTQLQIWQRINNKYVYDIRIKCYRKVLHMRASKLSDIKTGDVIKIINNDTMEFHHIIQRYAMRVINAGMGTVISLAIVAFIKWEIALFMAIVIPVSTLFAKRVEKKMKTISDELRAKQGKYSAWLMEILKGLREIKLFVAEKTVLHIFMRNNYDIVRSSIKQTKTQFNSDQLIDGIYFLCNIVFYIISAIYVASGSINIGEYVAIASYYSTVSSYFKRVLRGNLDYQKRKASVERVIKLLDEEEECDDGLSELEVTDGKIDIQNVSFAYNKGQDVLKNLTLSIKPGEKIGVVGQSGVGKSTLAHMLIKFYEPQMGTISIDGYNIAKCKYSSLRNAVGIVSQESIIFNTTVRDNITFGVVVDDEILWSVLEKAYLKSEIEQLPHGLDTILGKEGMMLSGGQNQRLCIARIIFRNPKIIILDEATSALDAESEEIVQLALSSLSQGKTTIIISHRYSSLCHTDRILVLSDGIEVGCGSCEELMGENKHFKEMFATQVGGAI